MAIRDTAVNPVTANEIAVFVQWCSDHAIKNDDGTADADYNSQVVAGFLLDKLGIPEWTRQSLDAALVHLRPHLRFYSAAEQQWISESRSLSPADRERILQYVRSSKNLKSSGEDDLFTNAVALANWIVSHNYLPVGNPSLDVILSQVAAQSRYPLVKQVHLQGSEAEAQAAREAANNQQTPKHTDDDIPSYVPTHLKEHYRQNQQALKQKEVPSTQFENQMPYFEKASRELVANITSNNDRAEAEKFLRNDGGNWEFTYRRLRTWTERRNQERNSVGR